MRIRSALASAGSLALAATLIAAPAQAGGHGKPPPRDPQVIAEGLAAPLSLDLGRRGNVYVTQNVAGILSTVDRHGTVSTVHRMTRPAVGDVELAGIAYHRGSTYHVETVVTGTPATSTSHIVKTSRDGTRTVVSEDLLKYEARNNPDQRQEYGFTDLRGTCREQVAEYQRAADRPPVFLGYKGTVESHAYQLEVHDGTIYVADAAASAVLTVNERTKKVRSATVITGRHIRHAQHGKPAQATTLFTTALPADVTVDGHHLYATVNAIAETGGSLVRYHLKGRR